MMKTESEFIRHVPCESCGSSDANALYTDGHQFCFACGAHQKGDGDMDEAPVVSDKRTPGLIPSAPSAPIQSRKLSLSTCQRFGYFLSTFNGKPVQVAPYYDKDGALVAQKVRFKDKSFMFLGEPKKATLFGQTLWRNGGKRIIVTEGEIDALSVSEVHGDKPWPVVSLPNGAQGAKRDLSKNLEWLLSFEEIVLMFDNDDPGREASKNAASIFPPGRCKIATLPLKDANDMLRAGRGAEVKQAIWEAKEYRPDGVVTIDDIMEEVLADPVEGLPWFCKQLTKHTYGRRNGEIYALGAGTGIGKTDFLTQQMAYDLTELKQPIAVFALEQKPTETVKRIAGKVACQQFHIPDGSWTKDELREALGEVKQTPLFLYDNFGATDWSLIANTMRHLAHSCNVKLFYIDHLTALAQGADEGEREGLEKIMAEMGSLVKELDCVIHLVSHLATPEGKPHEEGGRVMIRHFKGSRAIGFWCHYMFGLERDQQQENEGLRKVTTLRVLKDRFTGRATGETLYFGYDNERGLLKELDHNPYKLQTVVEEAGFKDYGEDEFTSAPL